MKLNLGCGNRKNEGWVNVDKHKIFKPDVLHDLEKFPYPFEENSVDEMLLSHVLEHIGQNPDIFINIIKYLRYYITNLLKVMFIKTSRSSGSSAKS